MKRLLALPALVLFAAACSDTGQITQPERARSPLFSGSAGESAACTSLGIIHWWPADGNSGADVVGTANLTANGGGFTPAGKFAEAFLTSSSASFKHTPATQPLYSGDFTIDLWVKSSVPASSVLTFGSVFSSRDNSSVTGGFQIEKCGFPVTQCTTDYYSLDMRVTAGVDIDIDIGAIDTDWRHLAVTYNDATGDVVTYYQGAPASTASLSGALRIDLVKLGVNRDNSRWFPGSIDEVHIFDRVLTAQEIQQIFEADGAGCLGDDEGPVTTGTTATPNPVSLGSNVVLTANVDDTNTGGSDIASAAYNVNGGAFSPMSPADGSFDAVSENLTADITALATETGVSEVCVQGTDAPGNVGEPECILFVVYDPNGGFVTGGGWIDSPAGAYVADPSLTGKANFGFVSKYKKGASVPTGNTEFQFKAGDLNFHSTSYEWLVVNQNGANAQFKGEGTINGAGVYKFMLWAGDNNPDTFRIKITEVGGGIVYDNGFDQPIGGGSIKIHQQ